MNTDRREFLRMSAMATAGLALNSVARESGSAAVSAGTAVNPDIPDLKVVYFNDPAMIKISASTPLAEMLKNYTSFANQIANTDSARVAQNLDRMAYWLVQSKKADGSYAFPDLTPEKAWARIFRSSKKWADTKVAIKINARIESFVPRPAILDKVCKVLIGLGVPASNITVYDTCVDGSVKSNVDRYRPCVPSGVNVIFLSDPRGSSTMDAAVPGYGNKRCYKPLADGSTDILVNLAKNQEHDSYVTWTSMCCKNHYGTFEPAFHGNGTIDYILALEKSTAISGGTPARQQLCIVDALTGSTGMGGGTHSLIPPDKRTDRLVMGVFAPAVDYQVMMKIRKDIMGVNPTSEANKFLTAFGYSATDSQLQWVDASPELPQPVRVAGGQARATGSVTVSIAGSRGPSLRFGGLRIGETSQILIRDLAGRHVRTLSHHSGDAGVTWDRKDERGRIVEAGRYVVSLMGAGQVKGGVLTVK